MLQHCRHILIAVLSLLAVSAHANSEQFEQALQQLQNKSFTVVEQAIEQIVESEDVRAEAVLQLLLDNQLYYTKDSGDIVFATEVEDGYQITAIIGDKDLGIVSKRDLKRVRTNNTLRSAIRSHLAILQLRHSDAAIRLASVRNLYDDITPQIAKKLNAFVDKETNSEVKQSMLVAIALYQSQGDSDEQLLAIIEMQQSLEPSVYNRLTELSHSENEKVVKAAQKALNIIDQRKQLFANVETLFFGLSLGSVLVLAAIGLAITFGVMGVINMAHGELIMLGAYTTYLLQQLMPNYIGFSLLISIPAAFLVSAVAGIIIERGVIRHLYGRPLETLLATFGISLILQQLVRTLISPQNVPVENPTWMTGTLEINSVLSLTLNRLYIIAFCLVVFAALLYILKRTSLGLQVRAVAQNRTMARAMGVRSDWVDALTFGLGAGIAGVAGVALSQLTNVGPNLGQAYIIDSFMVVVFGGVGNLWGTLVAGLSLGVLNKFFEPWAGAVLAKIIILIFIILFIQKRPRGLFPQKGRAVEG